MQNIENIFFDDEITDAEILHYLSGKLSSEEQHAMEEKMLSSSFLNDAVEGLEHAGSTEKINACIQELNRRLDKKINQKKSRKKFDFKLISWETLSVVLILLLCLLAFAIIQMHK